MKKIREKHQWQALFSTVETYFFLLNKWGKNNEKKTTHIDGAYLEDNNNKKHELKNNNEEESGADTGHDKPKYEEMY